MTDYGKAGFDVETYSPVDIKTAGGWIYTRHPEAELLCFAPSIDGHCLPLWTPGQALPQDWLQAVYGSGHWAVAFNWFFEYSVFNNIMVRQLGLPGYLTAAKFDCVAARNRSYGMPQNLEGTTKALGIPMGKEDNYLRVTKPRAPSKLNPDKRWFPHTNPEAFDRLYRQCVLDEWGEVSVDNFLPEWNAHEQYVFKLDQQINIRGVPIDAELAHAAIDIIKQLEAKYNNQLWNLTGGKVRSHTKAPAIKEFVNSRGVSCTSIAKDELNTMLNSPNLPADVEQVLRIRQTMGLESIKKYYKFIAQCDPVTNRIYDQFMYYGAQATGRWAARGCQLHNMPRGSIKPPKGVSYDDYVDQIFSNVKKRNLALLEMLYENPVAVLSSIIRPMISAPPGHELVVADYSGIECCVLFWLADVSNGLAVLHSGGDIYVSMASDIYDVSYEQLKEMVAAGESIKRQMGKQAVLGLGYQMGAATFVNTVNGYNIVLDHATGDWLEVADGQVKYHRESQAQLYADYYREDGKLVSKYDQRDDAETAAGKTIVDAYRAKFDAVPKFWRQLEHAALETVRTGCPHSVGQYLTFELYTANGFTWLRCAFPSGRYLYWFDPRIEMKRAVWCKDDEDPDYREQLTFLKWVKGRYLRESTYGGDLAESVTQGVARDFLCNGMANAEAAGYPIVLHVHDELGAVMPLGSTDLKHFEQTICQIPAWGEGVPLTAEGWIGKHYRK